MKRNPHPTNALVRDCGVRAIALAFDLDYKKVFDVATECKRRLAPTSTRWSVAQGDYIYTKSNADATKGLNKESCLYALSKLGLDVVYKDTTMTDQDGEHYLYFYSGNLPDRCIAHVNRHWVAVRDGAVWDTWDSRGKRLKKLYGYVCLRSDL